MATDNVNQSGASTAADSAKEETAPLTESTGPDTAAAAPQAAADTTPTAPSAEAPTTASPEATPAPAPEAETAASPEAGDTEPSGTQDFSAMLENYEKESAASRQEGEIVRGIVVGISDQNVLVDIGYKSEGIVAREEFLDHQGNITVKRGEEVDVLIKSLENQDGYAILSRAAAMQVQSWERLRHAHQTHETIKGRVVERIKGGLNVDLDGVPAFLPGSQIDIRPVRNLEGFLRQEIEVRVIKLNRKRGNVVVSRKAVLEEVSGKKKAETLANIEEGVVLEGAVKNITDYWRVHRSRRNRWLRTSIDMSWRIQSPNDIIRSATRFKSRF
jgi:small subunit ribosomal protein S1